jgi:pimeloyl-ACP methyl ester carboxylesterase
MATYVLVHGGGHGGWCYDKLAAILRRGGHDVYAPSLTGLGDRRHLVSPSIDLNTHIDDIANVIFYHDLKGVILAGHSYGGMVITGVADRIPERLNYLVYLDASRPSNGQSLVDNAPAMMAFARSDSRTLDGTELVLWPKANSAVRQGITDPGDTQWMLERLTPHPWRCFEQKLELRDEDRVLSIPRAMINCTPTLAKREAAQLARALDGAFVWEIDTGHDLMITEPEVLAEMLLKLA